jgi:hypothetical protein
MKLFSRRVSQIARVSSDTKGKFFLLIFSVVLIVLAASTRLVSASDITPDSIINLTNADRKEKGAGELIENDKLTRAAEDKAKDMIAMDYFAHNSPEGIDPWHWFEKEGYDYNYAGENLAMDFASSEKMNQAWLDSPTHRANMLNEKFKEIGVAAEKGVISGHETVVVVQLFGSGDKSQKGEAQEEADKEGESEFAKLIPELPPGSEGKNKSSVFARPIITSPRSGEVISKNEVEVVGSAAPGLKVVLLGESSEIGKATADSEGWFRIKVSNLSEGAHELRVAGEKGSGGEIYRQQKTVFSVDQTKPKVSYHLSASENIHEYLVDISSNETGCSFEINGLRMEPDQRKKIFVAIPADHLASAVKVKDKAGNKTIGEINLANYFQGEKRMDLAHRFTEYIAAEKIFLADSGEEALRSNLGIAGLGNNY